jgi:nucleotide-binding universal stress UspA family protein
MSPVRTVLVSVESAAALEAALPIARVLSRLEQAASLVLYVGPPALGAADLLGKLGGGSIDLEGAMVEQACGPFEASTLRMARERMSAAIVIARDLLPEQLFCEAPCPVVLVPSRRALGPWGLSAVLFPHDGCPSTAALFAASAELAQSAGARVHVLHVGGAAIAPPGGRGALACPRYVDQPQHEWAGWTSEFVRRFASLARADSQRLCFAVAVGDPASEILAAAEADRVDLIVLPWKGALDGERAKIFRAVLRGARCPVMTVRAGP